MYNVNENQDWIFIEETTKLDLFYRDNRGVDWLAFDTEFIPERYYFNKLCLISVVTPISNYIIDVLKLPHIRPFIKMLEDPAILKITHAGENDYRILTSEYHVKPRNIFDIQLSYGFLDFDYPLGLQTIVEKELKTRMNKVEMRSDWEKRPLTQEQLKYAVSDVIHLYPLMNILKKKLSQRGKLAWSLEENLRWEEPDYFSRNPAEGFAELPLRNLTKKQKIFLIRLHQWRHDEAAKSNCPLNDILKTRHITTITKSIKAGKEALLNDRTLPDHILHQYWPHFDQLYHQEISDHEHTLLENLPPPDDCSPQTQVMMELLFHLVKMKAVQHTVSPTLLLPRREINKMKAESSYFPYFLENGWRKEMLGSDLILWLKKRKHIEAVMDGYTCILKMSI